MENQIRDKYMKLRQSNVDVKSDQQEWEEIKKSKRFFGNFRTTILPTNKFLEMKGIEGLKSKVRYLVEIRAILLPPSWEKIVQVIKESKSESRFYSFKQVKTTLLEKSKVSENSTENTEECLRYFSNSGTRKTLNTSLIELEMYCNFIKSSLGMICKVVWHLKSLSSV